MAVQQKEWQAKAATLATLDLSWRQIANILKQPKSTVSDYLRKQGQADEYEPKIIVHNFEDEPDFMDWEENEETVFHDNSRVLLISDIHAPYQHPKTLEFLHGLKVRYEPTRVISLGDETDKHALSFHDSDPDLDSAGPELEKAAAFMQELEKMFPVMDIIDSNHGSMVYRKSKHHGIPRRYIKPYNEVLGVGDGWKWHMDLVLTMAEWEKPDVYVHHGKSADGLKLSQTMGMSCVQGHYHEKFNIQYWANPLALYFSMQCGCLIDDKSLAFSYNNVNLKRPLIGTGLIVDGIPVLEAMPL